MLTKEHNFDEALEKALGAVAAEKDVAAFSQADASHATPQNKLDSDGRPPYRHRRACRPSGKGRGKKPLYQNQNNSTSECLSCGKTGHPRSQCKCRNYTCSTCSRSGHSTAAFKSKSQKIRTVEEPEAFQLDPPSNPFFLSVFSINAENKGIEVPVELNGIHFVMELDTGAGVSIISQETYNRHFKETLLQPCDTSLRTYTGHPFQVSGQFLVQLKYQNQNVTVPLLVVKGSAPSHFGRNWLSRVKLYWKKICSIRVSDRGLHRMSSPNCTVQCHSNVFKPGLGVKDKIFQVPVVNLADTTSVSWKLHATLPEIQPLQRLLQ